MSDEEDAQVQDVRVDWIIERLLHRPLMFKQDRINKMKIDENSTCVSNLPDAHTRRTERVVWGILDCRVAFVLVSLVHQPREQRPVGIQIACQGSGKHTVSRYG